MGLYKRFPVLCTLWAWLEVVLFGGVIFGWGSLLYILKEEGFYLDACDAEKDSNISGILNSDYSDGISDNNSYTVVDSINLLTTNLTSPKGDIGALRHSELLKEGCKAQESKLNLWFTIAVSFQYLAFGVIGNAIRVAGLRVIRCIFLVIYLIGTLCLALATPEVPWLLLPGLTCIGTAGLTILATNMQVANLQPRYRSTIVAIFTGLFDFSSINKQVIRIAFENGIPRRTCYVIVTILCFTMVTTSTFFFLPKESVTEKHVQKVEKHRKKHKKEGEDSCEESNEKQEVLLKSGDKELEALGIEGVESTMSVRRTRSHEEPTICSTLFSLTCILHLYWLFVHALRFVTFIGLVNAWLENLFDGDEAKVGDLLGVFSYMTMGAIGTAFLCGITYDWQRRRYERAPGLQRTYYPVILPMLLVILYSMMTTVLCYIRHWISPYLAFAVFTFLRSWLFTVAVAFVGDTFPISYFGVLFGVLQVSAGVAGLLQYPIFEWYKAYDGASAHVNIAILALQASTVIHPLVLWIRARKDNSKGATEHFTDMEVHVTPQCA